MATEASNKFKIWITRAVDFSGTSNDSGFRAAMYGSTADDIVNVYMLNSPGASAGITDSTTDYTDDGDISIVGDLQCIDFNDGGTATDASGSCGALTLTSAGAPISSGSGDESISWVAASMKASMNSITAP